MQINETTTFAVGMPYCASCACLITQASWETRAESMWAGEPVGVGSGAWRPSDDERYSRFLWGGTRSGETAYLNTASSTDKSESIFAVPGPNLKVWKLRLVHQT
jgi:hypothetical protein